MSALLGLRMWGCWLRSSGGMSAGGRLRIVEIDIVVDDAVVAAEHLSEDSAADEHLTGILVDAAEHGLLCSCQLRKHKLIGGPGPHRLIDCKSFELRVAVFVPM